jgi:hypothetical protein
MRSGYGIQDWDGDRFPHAAYQRGERHFMRLGSVQCTLRDEEVIPLQFAFLRNVFAVVKTAGLLIATVGTERELQFVFFRHEDEFVMWCMGGVIYFNCQISPFKGVDDRLHSFLSPQRVVVACDADRQE